jgi:hypothetical protein
MVPEAKIRGSQKGFQWVILRLERVQRVRKGVRRGPVGPPGPLELAALKQDWKTMKPCLGEIGPLSQGVQARRKALRIRHINGMEVRKKRHRGFKKRPRGFK